MQTLYRSGDANRERGEGERAQRELVRAPNRDNDIVIMANDSGTSGKRVESGAVGCEGCRKLLKP